MLLRLNYILNFFFRSLIFFWILKKESMLVLLKVISLMYIGVLLSVWIVGKLRFP